jgi:hypothetical protein
MDDRPAIRKATAREKIDGEEIGGKEAENRMADESWMVLRELMKGRIVTTFSRLVKSIIENIEQFSRNCIV